MVPNKGLPSEVGQTVLIGIAAALEYIHTKHQLAHLDLKAENVLLGWFRPVIFSTARLPCQRAPLLNNLTTPPNLKASRTDSLLDSSESNILDRYGATFALLQATTANQSLPILTPPFRSARWWSECVVPLTFTRPNT